MLIFDFVEAHRVARAHPAGGASSRKQRKQSFVSTMHKILFHYYTMSLRKSFCTLSSVSRKLRNHGQLVYLCSFRIQQVCCNSVLSIPSHLFDLKYS